MTYSLCHMTKMVSMPLLGITLQTVSVPEPINMTSRDIFSNNWVSCMAFISKGPRSDPRSRHAALKPARKECVTFLIALNHTN